MNKKLMERKQISKSKKEKEQKGITLIALVITIIVLLILAAVSIAMLTGQNGILTKAQSAQSESTNKQADEKVKIAIMGSYDTSGKINKKELKDNLGLIDGIDKSTIPTNDDYSFPITVKVDEIQVKIKENATTGTLSTEIVVGETTPTGNKVTQGQKAEENGTIDGKTGSYSNPVIPKGFKTVDTDTAKWGTTDSYKAGLVIEDAEITSTTVGSQFVWVPVQNYSDFHLIEGYYDGSLDTMLDDSTNITREAGADLTQILPGKPNKINNVKGTAESVAMYSSVSTNGGFYIARYEAGISGTTDNYSLATPTVTDGSVKPLSKSGLGVWNSICWGGTTALEASDGLQGNDNSNGAVKVARSMYNDSTKYGAKSSLCYDVEWDATMNFIDSEYINKNCATNSFVRDSTGKGNYTRTIATTGSNDSYAVNNIYDLGGNVWELNMGAYSTDYRVSRGGFYGDSDSDLPASGRGYGTPDLVHDSSGFRATLIL